MLSWPGNTRVLVCTKPTDMRKQFDGLHGLVTEIFGHDVFDGRLFVFFNRRRDRLKALRWDRDRLAIFAKKLDKNRYALPRFDADHAGVEIDFTSRASTCLEPTSHPPTSRQRQAFAAARCAVDAVPADETQSASAPSCLAYRDRMGNRVAARLAACDAGRPRRWLFLAGAAGYEPAQSNLGVYGALREAAAQVRVRVPDIHSELRSAQDGQHHSASNR